MHRFIWSKRASVWLNEFYSFFLVLFLIPYSNIIVFAVPFVNPKTQSKHDHDHTLSHTTIQNVTSTDIDAIGRSINHNNAFHNHVDANASAFAATATAADGGTVATPPHIYGNSNSIQSNANSIFMPASTSKYPIKQSTIAEDFRERFVNIIVQWIRAVVYLARKWLIWFQCKSKT